MILRILLLAALFPLAANASPCSGVDRHETLSPAATTAIAKQLGVPSLQVRRAFGALGWNVVEVEPPHSEPAFLFYNGDPAASRYLTLWAGAAEASEEQSIRDWAMQNAPGLPPLLAGCFAWSMMPGQRK